LLLSSPSLTTEEVEAAAVRERQETETVAELANKKKRHESAVAAQQKPHKILCDTKKKVGRPVTAKPMTANAPSILQFLKFKPRSQLKTDNNLAEAQDKNSKS
jgi:predicted house-cleaning NTP pyrophosphatase (Maf/HAM1 superfamily)